MDKFKNKYRIASARLQNWDYGSPGLYFITICTKNRVCYFGDIPIAEAQNTVVETQNFASLTQIGLIAYQYWADIPEHFPFVELGEFIIMPNHLHGILSINKPGYDNWLPNKFGPQSKNLASVIRGYKAGVKTFATKNNIEFGWQERFHEHIIRNHDEYLRISNYIINNPANWGKDKFFK